MQIKIGNYYIKKHSNASMILMMWLLNVVFLTIARFVLTKLNIYGLTRSFVLTGITLIPIVFFLLKLSVLKKKNYYPFLLLYLTICLIFLISYLLHPEYQYFYTREGYGLERVFRPDSALYAFLFFSLVDDPDDLMHTIKKFAFIYFAYLMIFELLPALVQGYWSDINYAGETVKRAYSLSFGYAMLLPSIIFLYIFFKKKSILYLLLSVAGIGLIFLQGSRGALLMLAIFVGLMVISGIIDSKDATYKTIKIIAIILAIVFIFAFGGTILRTVVNMLKSIGFESRTLDLLVSGDFTNDSGRNIIWSSVYDAIKTGGLFGYGAFGDRPFVFPHHYVGYSHNIFLELICSFGIIGGIISVVIVVGSLRMIFSCKDTRWREIFIIFFSIASQLLLSMSFWYVWEFWAAAAIAYKYFHLKR